MQSDLYILKLKCEEKTQIHYTEIQGAEKSFM